MTKTAEKILADTTPGHGCPLLGTREIAAARALEKVGVGTVTRTEIKIRWTRNGNRIIETHGWFKRT